MVIGARRVMAALSCSLLAVAAAVTPAAAAPETERVIVRLKAGAGETRDVGRKLMDDTGGSLGPVYAGVMKGFAAKVPAGRLNALRNHPKVDVVFPDAPISADNAEVPPGVRRVGADRFAGTTIGSGRNVDADIAILDTGVNPHADLNLAGGVSCASDAGCVGTNYTDVHGHGTHVAGTAAARDNGVGVVGTAPGARVWAVKVLGDSGSGSLSWFLAGLDWVVGRGGIEVANASLGGARWSAVDDAVARATADGVVVVVAAGNSGVDASTVSPASAPNAITVSAYQDNDGAPGGLGGAGDDTAASFTNYGAAVDVAAPGVAISSTSRGGGYQTMSGTSMAAPHVAGAAAAYITTSGVAASATRWRTVLDAFHGEWGAGQASACGFTGGRSSEPVLVMGGCAGGDTVPPTRVSLRAVAGDRQVALHWPASTDASGIAGYRIYRATGATGAWSLLATVAGERLGYTDTTVLNTRLYRYYVTAVDRAAPANVSAASETVTATPADTTPPPTPSIRGAGGDRKATLSWNRVEDSSGMRGYQLWRAVGTAAPTLRSTVAATASTYVDTNVANGTAYRYTIRAVDAAGNASPASAPAVVTPVDDMAPTVPVPSIVVGDGRLTLKWAASKDSSGVASYAIYRAEGTAPFGPPVVVSGSTLTFVDTGLVNGRSYRYAMSATDVHNQTSPSSAARIAAPQDLTGPAAVTLTGSASPGRVDLSWTQATDPSGISSYRVFRAVGTATTFSMVASLPATTRTHSHTGLIAGGSYRYLVKAVDARGNVGAASTTLALTLPTTTAAAGIR